MTDHLHQDVTELNKLVSRNHQLLRLNLKRGIVHSVCFLPEGCDITNIHVAQCCWLFPRKLVWQKVNKDAVLPAVVFGNPVSVQKLWHL